MKVTELLANEYAPFYAPYIAAFEDGDLNESMEISLHEFIRFVREIPMERHDYIYAENKWTIKDILQHLIDAERIFSYRALRIARNDKTPLPGFEENNYAAIANGGKRSIQELLTEFSAVRYATLQMFKSFSKDELLRKGIASNNEISVRAIGFITIGHVKHHERIFRERYLTI